MENPMMLNEIERLAHFFTSGSRSTTDCGKFLTDEVLKFLDLINCYFWRLDNDGKLAVIHNGIIENYSELKAELQTAGHTFHSETDTESVAHLLSDEFKITGDLAEAMRKVCKELRGSFTLLALHSDQPERIIGARRNSPLVVGVGKGENFLASDVSAFIAHTKRALELGQDQVVDVTPEKVVVTDLDGVLITPREYEITWDSAAAERGGFSHFMLKEIFEQPKAISDTMQIGRAHV